MPRYLLLLSVLVSMAVPAFGQDAFDGWERAMLSGRYAEAAQIAEAIAEGGSASWALRTAEALAQAGEVDQALHFVEVAASRGYSGIGTVDNDADLDPLRDEPRFIAARDRIAAAAAERMGRFREAAEQMPPTIVLPPKYDASKPAPLIIALHGTGGTGEGIAKVYEDACADLGAILVAPDALRPAGGGGYSWVFRDEAAWYIPWLVERIRSDHNVGPVILTGYSQGANIAFMLGQAQPGIFDAVIPVNGHYESDVAALPSEHGPAWYLIIGERDPWAKTYTDAERDFRKAGMPVARADIPRRGHELPADKTTDNALALALEWCLQQVLNDE